MLVCKPSKKNKRIPDIKIKTCEQLVKKPINVYRPFSPMYNFALSCARCIYALSSRDGHCAIALRSEHGPFPDLQNFEYRL